MAFTGQPGTYNSQASFLQPARVIVATGGGILGVKMGSVDINAAFVGSTAVDKMYVGTTQIWP